MTIKTTPLTQRHINLGAKMVSFAGYQMPIQYSGITNEHLAVRERAGVFDISHMGEFFVSGKDAERFLQYITINDVTTLQTGDAQYTAICDEKGGIIDDIILYRYENYYMVVVNASNIAKDFQWMDRHREGSVVLNDRSDEIGLVAIQGPRSREILLKLGLSPAAQLGFYRFAQTNFQNEPLTLARTGYTGELGFEAYGGAKGIQKLWDAILDAGAPIGVIPVGLGARDTLRMEMKYCLYGNDIGEDTNPLEAGLGWITKFGKGDFIGRSALLKTKANPTRRLVCLTMEDRAIPRHGYEIFSDDEKIGYVTSGTQSPSLQKGIALAYVNLPYGNIGDQVAVDIRGNRKPARVVRPPFYQTGTVRN